jgi:hypothetical protein
MQNTGDEEHAKCSSIFLRNMKNIETGLHVFVQNYAMA